MISISFKKKIIRFDKIENFDVFVKFDEKIFFQLFFRERNSVNFVKKFFKIFDENCRYVYRKKIRQYIFVLFFEFIQHFKMFESHCYNLIFVLNRHFHECNNCDFCYVCIDK